MSVEDTLDPLDRLKDETQADHNKWVGVYIGILAVVLAICNVGGANAAKDANRANIEAANTWSFYQAKNIRRAAFNLAADDLELQLKTQSAMPQEARQAVEGKLKNYRSEMGRLKSDPEDGMDQLLSKGKSLESERDIAMRKDPYFDWSQALLQIAIVLASVHLIIGNNTLLALSGGLAALGLVLMLNGFTLAFSLPLLG